MTYLSCFHTLHAAAYTMLKQFFFKVHSPSCCYDPYFLNAAIKDHKTGFCFSHSLQIPGNLVPITHIQSAAGAAINAQIQTKTSPQGTTAGQPTPILPNTPLSPPSGMTTVTLNTRPILPQQQQQRKISAGKSK